MRFTPIPDAELLELGGPDNIPNRVIFGPPADDTTGIVGLLEVAAMRSASGVTMYAARVELEAGDLERLAAGFPIYVSQYGGVCPISVDIPFDVVRSPEPGT